MNLWKQYRVHRNLFHLTEQMHALLAKDLVVDLEVNRVLAVVVVVKDFKLYAKVLLWFKKYVVAVMDSVK